MYTSGFLSGGTQYTVCLLSFVKLNMGRVEVLCPSHHEHLDSRLHCVWRLSHTVRFLPHTVSCTLLAQCC